VGDSLLLPALIAETGPVSEGLRVREIDDGEGRRLLRIVRRGSGPPVTWRRARMVLGAGRPGPRPRSRPGTALTAVSQPAVRNQ